MRHKVDFTPVTVNAFVWGALARTTYWKLLNCKNKGGGML